MNPEPIDEQRISMLFAQSDAAEEARARTAEAWRSYKAREKRQKRLFFLVMLPLLAGASIFAVVTLQRVFRSTEPEKPAKRVLDGKARNPEASGARAQFNEEGRMISVSF